jgi:type III secretion regulatory protein HpaA
MTRISHGHSAAGDTAAANAQKTADAQQKSANAQGARNGAQFAALYRGTTNFTYGSDAQRNAVARSNNARRMASQLARKKRALSRQRKGARGIDDDDGGEAEMHDHENKRVTRDGGGKGGGQQHGDDHDEQGARAAQSIKAGRGKSGVGEPAGKLGALAQELGPGDEARRMSAVRDAWGGQLLALMDELDKHPGMALDARVMEHSLDLLSVQQTIGRLPAAGLGGFIERLKGLPPRAVSAGMDGINPHVQRQRDLSLLAPLLYLHGDLPSTPAQRNRAIGKLSSMRAAAIVHAPGAAADTPAANDHG